MGICMQILNSKLHICATVDKIIIIVAIMQYKVYRCIAHASHAYWDIAFSR